MKTYQELLQDVYTRGVESTDRTGVGTLKVFGRQWRHDMADGFPLLTTKRMSFKIVVHELLWMLRGMTNIRMLQEAGVTIWDEWADENGDLGPIYGKQWRNFDGGKPGMTVDQLETIYNMIKKHPDSRRMVVTAWSPCEIGEMGLPPCHLMFQFGVMGDRLNLHMFMRSADLFLGVPYNIAFYGLMLSIFSQSCGYKPGELVVSFTDLHIYLNHKTQVEAQIGRIPFDLPRLDIEERGYLNNGERVTPWDYIPAQFSLSNYNHHAAIKADVAV